VGAIIRPGFEDPWQIGEFYGQSDFCHPRGQILAIGSRASDDIVIADLIREVRNTWQFSHDRRPESYGAVVESWGCGYQGDVRCD
jgi:N-carbamoylputrescine amidase